MYNKRLLVEDVLYNQIHKIKGFMKRYNRKYTMKNLEKVLWLWDDNVLAHCKIYNWWRYTTSFKLALIRNVAELQLTNTIYEPNKSTILSPA